LAPLIGAYPADYLWAALEEEGDLKQINNLDLIWEQVYHPLRAVAISGESGGVRRMIAQEQFRTLVEQSDWYIDGSLDDFADEGKDIDEIIPAEYQWSIWFDGPIPEITPKIRDESDVLRAVLGDPSNTLILIGEASDSFVYVLRSPLTANGRLREGLGFFLDGEEVDIALMHEEGTQRAYALPREYLEAAADEERFYEG
jgi:hypothetical protein